MTAPGPSRTRAPFPNRVETPEGPDGVPSGVETGEISVPLVAGDEGEAPADVMFSSAADGTIVPLTPFEDWPTWIPVARELLLEMVEEINASRRLSAALRGVLGS